MTRPTLAEAKRDYPHRFTMEHVPAWSRKPLNGQHYAPQFRSDREWYENTIFPGEPGIDRRAGYCQTSNQSWPLGHWLTEPYSPRRAA